VKRALVMAGLLAAAAVLAQGDLRRSGLEFMTPALQALQRDDTRNPGALWIGEGQALWTRTVAQGKSCADCHDDGSAPRVNDAAARYPAFDATLGKPLTLAGRIDRCRVQHQGLPAQGADGEEVLAASALLAHRARGVSVAPAADPRMQPWRERGARLWQQRLGQLNLSCMQCHDDRAGQRLGGAAIAQAHPTGYPSYRLEWQTLGSLERRLRGCVAGVRAEPFSPGADEWLALEVYLAQRAAGMLHEGVAVRP
jgi:L-cysteine S-thiosulfotransferase